MEAFSVLGGPGLSNSNVIVNIFWTNSPTKEHDFLKIEVEEKCPILMFQKKVVKLIMGEDKIQFDEQEIEKDDYDLNSRIQVITNDGYFLSKKDEYLTIGDFKEQMQNRESGLLVIVQTKTSGLVYIDLNSLDALSTTLPFNLRLDTLATVKSKIHDFSKIPAENPLKILYNGKDIDLDKKQELDRPILEFWKEDNHEIWYFEPTAAFIVYILTLTGKKLVFAVQPTTTVEELKSRIEKSEGIRSSQQRLVFGGYQLIGEKKLAEYHIQDGSKLHLILWLSGGGGGGLKSVGAVSIPGISFADLSDSRNLVQRAFSTEAPKWRIAKEGLNIEGICGNSACEAFKHQVIDPRGHEDFHLKNDYGKINCPTCHQTLKELRTCGFASTFWRYFGRKGINASELLYSDWAEAGDEGYTTFDVNKSDGGLKGMESWSLLVIQARPVFKDKSGKYPQPAHCGFCFHATATERTKLQLKRLTCGHIYHEDCTKKSHFRCNLCVFNIH